MELDALRNCLYGHKESLDKTSTNSGPQQPQQQAPQPGGPVPSFVPVALQFARGLDKTRTLILWRFPRPTEAERGPVSQSWYRPSMIVAFATSTLPMT